MAVDRRNFSVKIESALNAMTYSVGLVSFLSVIRYIAPVFSVAFICMFFLAAWFDYRRRITIPRSVLNISIVLFVLLNALRISLDNMAAPLVEMLLILMAIKFAEEKKPRDYMQIYTLSVFLLTGSALLSLDIQFVVMLLILAIMLPVASVLLTFYSQKSGMDLSRRDLSQIVSRAMLITVASIPLAALLFIILPRTGYPLLNLMNRAGASTGFTDNVRLGEVASIQENASVILRVVTPRIDNEALYWRGIVMDYFDGASWRSSGYTGQSSERIPLSGKKVLQTIYLEPYENRYLFALDKPFYSNYPSARLNGNLEIVSRRNIDSRIKYDVISVLSGVIAVRDIERERYLQLPHMDFSKTLEVVRRLRVKGDDAGTSENILKYLKYGNFSYSLRGLPITRTPIEDFLFKYRYGNCEYFASAMAVMLRLSDIPARLVGGYTGGNYNDLGGYYVVTQDRAHVWVEAFIVGRGWVRLDPTPGSSGIQLQYQKGLFFRIRMLLDGINYYWNAMVIGYDFNSQVKIFTGLSNMVRYPAMNPAAFKRGISIAGAVLLAVFIIASGIYKLMKIKSPEKRLVDEFERIMKSYGLERLSGEGLEEFAQRIPDGRIRERALDFVADFQGLYYRDRKLGRDELARLRGKLETLRK